MNNTTILILGGGVMQLPALRIAKLKSWKILLADGKEDIPGIKYADKFMKIDLKDKEGMAEMAIAYKNKNRLDGVFTAGTDFSTTVAWVAEKCGLPGISYDTALKATDKFKMRKALEESGVPIPKYAGIGKNDNPLHVLENIKFPLVVKPVDNMGSRCVRRVDSEEELKEAVKHAIDASRTSGAIVEEFMDGKELSLDAIVYKGEITICGIADRHIFFPPYFVEMGHTMPSGLENEILENVSDVFKRGIKAIGIDNGAAKGDIKITEKGIKIGEIAARLSGGYMSGWTYPYSSGIEITEAGLNIAAGFEPGKIKPIEKTFSAERAFISIPGNIKDIYGIKMLKDEINIKEVFLRVKRGDNVVFPKNNVEKCGNIISKGKTREIAVDTAENSINKILIRLKPGNPDTDSFIFKKENLFYNSIFAFNLKNHININAYKKMPLHSVEVKSDDIVIKNLPQLYTENSKDWHGTKLTDAFKRLVEITGIELSEYGSEEKEKLYIGKLFWDVFLKGGVQAGVYIIDTIRERISKNQNPFRF